MRVGVRSRERRHTWHSYRAASPMHNAYDILWRSDATVSSYVCCLLRILVACRVDLRDCAGRRANSIALWISSGEAPQRLLIEPQILSISRGGVWESLFAEGGMKRVGWGASIEKLSFAESKWRRARSMWFCNTNILKHFFHRSLIYTVFLNVHAVRSRCKIGKRFIKDLSSKLFLLKIILISRVQFPIWFFEFLISSINS